jgi:hypothetical protein
MMKKLFVSILLAGIAATALAAPDSNEQYPLSNPAVDQAVFVTQWLSVSICHEKANLDPKVLANHSTAFMFLLALKSVGTVDVFSKNVVRLTEKVKLMKCDQSGVLQLELPEGL